MIPFFQSGKFTRESIRNSFSDCLYSAHVFLPMQAEFPPSKASLYNIRFGNRRFRLVGNVRNHDLIFVFSAILRRRCFCRKICANFVSKADSAGFLIKSDFRKEPVMALCPASFDFFHRFSDFLRSLHCQQRPPPPENTAV